MRNSSTIQPFSFSTSYYTHDGNKNVSEVTASTGALAAHYDYAPFGALTVSCDGEDNTDSSSPIHSSLLPVRYLNPWRFSSEYAEDDTATVYYNYRHYESVMGRWMRRDPIEEDGSYCLYVFVGNGVLDYVDILGLWLGEPNWFTKKGHTHKELTEAAYPFTEGWELDGPICLYDNKEKILDAISEANINTDEGDTANKQQFHYCTGLSKIREDYQGTWDYDGYRDAYTNQLAALKSEFDDIIVTPNKSNCDEALRKLGMLTHMWQDYYAHGVTGPGGSPGKINGSPDNPTATPSSYGWMGFKGGHGGLFRLASPFSRVEPGDRAEDSDERARQAIEFVSQELSVFLRRWGIPCCCVWEN